MIKKSLLAVTAMMLTAAVYAEPISGVLTIGKQHSALVSVSEGSGDVVAYTFANQSSVGKTIFNHCLPEMWCEIAQPKVGTGDIPNLGFDFTVSGGWPLLAAKGVSLTNSQVSYGERLKTRYGVLSVNADGSLRLNNKKFLPHIQANSSLSFVGHYEMGKTDFVLVQNTGGTACPALFHIVSLNPQKHTGTAEFGTCSDYFSLGSLSNDGLTMYVADFNGNKPKRVTYRLSQGKLTENGKPVK